MAQRITQVDAFTDRRFAGNPAAVCVLSEPADPRWMQDVAAEMNLSETAFAIRRDGEATFNLRWFTPNSEVDLCGHATLATAHVLWEEGHISAGPVPPLRDPERPADRARRGPDGIELDFPSEPVESEVTSPEESRLARGGDPGPDPLRRPESVRHPRRAGGRADARGPAPDIRKLEQLPARGVIVTSRSDNPGFDFASRFFAPCVGVDEDPVCGSAHCCLGPYWGAKLGKSALDGRPPALPTRRGRRGPPRGAARRPHRPGRDGAPRRIGLTGFPKAVPHEH